MSDKTTLQIAIAVQECQPLTEEEMRLAIQALSQINYFIGSELDKLIDAIEEQKSPQLVRMRVTFARDIRERMFQAAKKPPSEWLGPEYTPGTPEYKERLRIAKAIFKKATGQEI